MRIVVHREIREDPDLLRRWNALASQMEVPAVFYTCEWALAMQSAYQASLKPFLVLGYEGDELAGVACLGTDPAQRRVTFLTATTADYCDFLSHPGLRHQFVGAVLSEIGKMKVSGLALANIPAESATPAALSAAAGEYGFHIYTRPAYLCAQIDLGAGEIRHALKNTLQNKKKFRRYLRELEREGPVTFVHLQSWEELRTALPRFADAHVARFETTHRVSSLTTPERRHFIEDLARRFADTGVVTLSLMMVSDQPVAWNYGFQYCGSWFWYQPTFDSRYEESSPGHCLLSRIVIEACDMSTMRLVDLGLGAEGYKERFANNTRQTLHATLTKSSLRHLREVARYRIATAVKRSSKLEAVIRSVRSRLRS
ncbi:MAG: GNAT family N-acetyltransferase [Candidatus Sulfotelmatobacter sp.]